MKATFISKEKNDVKFSIEFTPEEFEQAQIKAYKASKHKFTIDGFRKGKAPRSIIEMHYGEGIFFEDAVNDLFSENYPKALDELELDVIDHYNGSQRSVRTLSGGESFKASLCLALGLSDEIQSSAGGIRLDTMFVDEGFGSLDDESLQQAIKVLSGLSEGNKLVGIISHVGELKERIEKQIVVKKDRVGGSRAEIRVEA